MATMLRSRLAGTLFATWLALCAADLTLRATIGMAAPPIPAGGEQELSFTLGFASEDLTVSHDGDIDRVALKGAIALDPKGLPLPLYRIAFLLPEGKEVTSVEVAPAETWMVPGTFRLQTGSERLYPERLEQEVRTATMRGYWIGTVLVSPLQFVPATGELRLHRRLEIRVELDQASPELALSVRRRAPARARDTLERREIAWLQSFVANPQDLDRFYGGGAGARAGLDAGRPFAGFVPTPFPSTDGPPVEFVIVTDSVAVDARPVGNLVAEFQRLADWKTAKGTPAVVRTVSWIRAHYPGHDDPARIRAFLIDAYELWGTDYVLLGGDLRIVPGRRFNGLNLGFGHPPADVYYGGLDSSWDLDHDGVYGESTADAAASDPFWDVWVGRAPVENRAEASVLVDKSLGYARAPGTDLTGLDPEYYERILLMEGLANCAIWGQACNGIYVGETIYRRIAPPFFERTRMYQQLLDPNPACAYHLTYLETADSVQVDWTTEAALDALNRGSGFVHHYEHSNPYAEGGASGGFGCAVTSGGALGREYIDLLTNRPNWSIVYSTGAGVHAFDYESVSEHWVLNPNGGAAAYIGKTRSGSVGNTTGEVDTLLFGNIFQDRMTVGQAMAMATQSVAQAASVAVSSFGLIGDPELQPWTAAPANLELSLTPQVFVPGEQGFEVRVQDAGDKAAVAGARVALVQGELAYAFGLTGGDGVVRFGVNLPARDDVIVTATAPNYVPAVAVATASQLPSVQVSYKSHVAADDSAGVANGNGMADAGELVKVDVQVENTGLQSVTGVTGGLQLVGALGISPSVDGLCQPDLIFAGAAGSQPPGPGCELRFPEHEFRGVSPAGRPAEYLLTQNPGLFLWREGHRWRLIARGAPSPAPPGMRFAGVIHVPGGHAAATAGALEAGDQWSAAGFDSIVFDFVSQVAGDQDSLTFVGREIAWAAIPDSTGTFGSLIPGGVATSRFLVAFSNTIPDRHEPRFELALRNGGGAEVGRTSFSLPVAAPVLEYPRQAPVLNANGGTIAPVVRNAGSGDAGEVKAILRLASGVASISDSIVAFGPIGGLEEGDPGLDLFAFTTPDTSAVRFRVVIENQFPDGSQRTWTRPPIDVVRPCPPIGLNVESTHGRSARLKWMAPSAGCAQDLAGYNIYRRLISEAEFTLVAGSTADSTRSFQDVLILPDTTWVYAVAARDSSGNESAWAGPTMVGTWVPEHPGWPQPLDAGTQSSPLAVDVDLDGRLEIFALGNAVYAWRADGTPLLPGGGNADGTFFRPPRPAGSFSQGATGVFMASPAVADLDRDGALEIAVAAWDDSLWVLDAASGALRWGRHCVPKLSSPALGDVDGDGNLEVVIGSDQDTVYAWRHDGSPLIPAHPSGVLAVLPDGAIINYTTPALANIDADPTNVEVIYATFRGNVYSWDENGTLLWACDVGPNLPLSTPALGDVDRDGTIEAVVAQGNVSSGPAANALYIINAENGVVERSWSGSADIPGELYSQSNAIHPPSLADLDQDGDLEIVVGTSGVNLPGGNPRRGAGTVLLYDHDGGSGFTLACLDTIPLPGLNMFNFSGESVNAQPVIANLDGDGGYEIGAGSTTFALFLFEVSPPVAQCGAEPGWPLLVSGEVDATPFVGDVNGDGRFDMVVRSHDGEVHVFNLGAAHSSSAIEWGQFGHDPQHTSNYGTPIVVGVPPPQTAPAPAVFRLTQNAPNPFRPPTRIGFELGGRGRVRLSIYAVDGRLVRTLIDRIEGSGMHEATWDGRDGRGLEQPAGVYFYRLEAGERTAARKLLLVR
jgi:hypothetical protein